MENTKIQIINIDEEKNLSSLAENKAYEIKAFFEPFVKQLENFESDYNKIVELAEKEEISGALMKDARELRLKMVKVRTTSDKTRKTLKEESLTRGRAIDGIYNIIKYSVASKEEVLTKIEKHFENLEKERLAAIQKEREELIGIYVEQHIDYTLMAETEFDAYYHAMKAAHYNKIEEELAEKRRQKALEEENARLKKELEEAKKEVATKMDVNTEKVVETLEAYAKEEKNRMENSTDREKWNEIVMVLTQITENYTFSSEKSTLLFKSVTNLIRKVIKYITDKK